MTLETIWSWTCTRRGQKGGADDGAALQDGDKNSRCGGWESAANESKL